jgi:uncharacterized membrane protein
MDAGVDAGVAEVERAARRGGAERLIFFSDAVVAIAITLLAIDLPTPTGETNRELLASLAANSFAYVTFVISFIVIGAHWRAHHRVFRYLHAVDAPFVRLSFTWLLGIVATPFLTVIIREGHLDLVRFGLYALAQALLQIVLYALQWLAHRNGLYAPGSAPATVRPHWWRELAGPVGYLVSIPLYLLLGAWAFVLWAVVPNLSAATRLTRRVRARSAGR